MRYSIHRMIDGQLKFEQSCEFICYVGEIIMERRFNQSIYVYDELDRRWLDDDEIVLACWKYMDIKHGVQNIKPEKINWQKEGF